MAEISDDELKQLRADADEAKALKASNSRIVEESNKFKDRAQAAEGKLTDAEKAQMLKDGDKDKLLEAANNENSKLNERLKGNTKLVLKEKLRSEIGRLAPDAINVDDLISIGSKFKGELKYDEENLSIDGIENFIAKVRESNPREFNAKRMPNGKTPTPAGGPNDPPQDDRTTEERFRAELKAVKSRDEQKKVYEKYGKPVDSYMGR